LILLCVVTFVLLGNPDVISLEMYVKKLGPDISHLFVKAMKTLGEDDEDGGGDNFSLCLFLGPSRSNLGLSRS
jgi:hypothetical protein